MQEPTGETLVTPNSKYDLLFGTSYAQDGDERRYDGRRLEDERAVLSDLNDEESYTPSETYISTGEEKGFESDPHLTDGERTTPLTWEDFSLTTDVDHLRELATYYDGVTPSENPDAIREKIRSGEPEWYANAQVVVKSLELYGDDPLDDLDTGGETTEDTETTTTETTDDYEGDA